MKLLQRITVILFVLSLLACVGSTYYNRKYVDRTPPVIRCDMDTLDISVKHTDKDLLKGVTATDDRDGDITDSILIKGVTHLITKDTAQISYIVFDSSNNMASYQRTLHYTDYEKPQFSLSKPLVYPMGETVTLLDRLTATDVIDGDITSSIRITSQNINTNYIGVYSVNVQVSNSMGDTESLTLPVCIGNTLSSSKILLKQYIVYVPENGDFDPNAYLRSAKNSDGSAIPKKDIQIQSSVNTEKVGTYTVTYSHQSDTAYLTVVVR